MPHSGPVTPWFWSYPCYYIPLDYSRMYMQLYYIQYPSVYPNCIPQRPISNNLVEKDLNCNKEGEKDVKKNSKYLQPRWCLSGLSHNQKTRLKHLRRVTYEKSLARVIPPQISLSAAQLVTLAPSTSQAIAQKTLCNYSGPSTT